MAIAVWTFVDLVFMIAEPGTIIPLFKILHHRYRPAHEKLLPILLPPKYDIPMKD